jgi:GNAT superfamily N-acetyltransferase
VRVDVVAATLRSAVAADAERIAQILIDVRTAFMAYAPLAHSPEEVRSWVARTLVPAGGTVVAECDGVIVGVMTIEREVSCSWITQMAVDPPHVGNGIGSVLLQHAFRVCRLPIRLFTFQANAGARRFYERHGFRPVRLSDGRANEERCPDVLYECIAVPAPQ